MKVLATIEARMSSTRLPGKVMLPLGGQPTIVRMYERVMRAEMVTKVKYLTTLNPTCKIIADTCEREGIPVYRGSEEDVTERVIEGSAEENPDIIVQLTGDNPVLDPALIDVAVRHLIDNNLDCSATHKDVLIGLNVRCYKRSALLKMDPVCPPNLRVHGGYYITQNPEMFKLGETPVPKELYRSDIRLTVDEPNDYELVRRVFETLHPVKPDFGYKNILDLFERYPEWKAINGQVQQKKAGDEKAVVRKAG